MAATGENGRAHRLSDAVAAVVLAGGQNSRMGGADKAFLTVDGQPAVQRTLRLLQRCFPQVVVVSNRPEKYASFDVEVTRDEYLGAGPLGGIHAGLRLVRHPYTFVVACDMPFLRVEPIAFLVNAIDGQDAIVPWWKGDIEPLHAVYASRLRQRMDEALAAGHHAVRQFLPTIRVDYIPEAVMRSVEGADESFRNVNTPEEAARFAVEVCR